MRGSVNIPQASLKDSFSDNSRRFVRVQSEKLKVYRSAVRIISLVNDAPITLRSLLRRNKDTTTSGHRKQLLHREFFQSPCGDIGVIRRRLGTCSETGITGGFLRLMYYAYLYLIYFSRFLLSNESHTVSIRQLSRFFRFVWMKSLPAIYSPPLAFSCPFLYNIGNEVSLFTVCNCGPSP